MTTIMEINCRFCGHSGNIRPVCACPPPLGFAHLQCLNRHLRNNGSVNCIECGHAFPLNTDGRGFRDWFRNDPNAQCNFIVAPMGILFLMFISYVGFIHYITVYWFLNRVAKFFLIHTVNIIFFASLMALLILCLKALIDYQQWRQNTRSPMSRTLR